MENWIGGRIRNLRHASGITQEKLAELCNVSTSCVSRWETGSLYPRRESLLLLARALNVTPEEILNVTNTRVSEDKTIMESVFLLEKLNVEERMFFYRQLQLYYEIREFRVRQETNK